MKVLILNENRMLLSVVESTLAEEGISSISTSNGLEAFELIAREKPDLVIMDLLISFVTGFEVINFIRSIKGRYIKIIVLTKVTLDDVVGDAFDLGVDDYIYLPLQKKELVARIQRLEKYSVSNDSSKNYV